MEKLKEALIKPCYYKGRCPKCDKLFLVSDEELGNASFTLAFCEHCCVEFKAITDSKEDLSWLE